MQPAYFDDLALRLVGKDLQENHYDPWGLNLVGIESAGTPTHRFQFNGKEKIDALDLQLNDHGARTLSLHYPVWGQLDPRAEEMPGISPYAFGFNNPLRFFDADGEIPTRAEAALMAAHVYGDDVTLTGGWRPTTRFIPGVVYNNKNGFKSALYERTDKDGNILEYAYACAGTNDRKDGFLDLSQALWGAGKNSQYELAEQNATQIRKSINDCDEITAIGHSLGGALANTAAFANGWNSITFNAAAVTEFTKSRLDLKGRLLGRQSKGYVFRGDIVNYLQGLLRSPGFFLSFLKIGPKPASEPIIISGDTPGGGLAQRLLIQRLKDHSISNFLPTQ